MLNGKFDMKYMGLVDAEKILEKFKIYSSGTAKTLDTIRHLTKNSDEAVSQVVYAQIIGSLMYLTNCKRPDLAHAINVLCLYTSNPGHKLESHKQGGIRKYI